MKALIAIIAAIIILGGGYYWYTTQQSAGTGTDVNMQDVDMSADTDSDVLDAVPTTTPTTSTSAPGTSSATSGAVKSFTISGKNFSFTPATMTVKKGDTVRITFNNTGGTHDLRVDGYNIGTKTLQSGASETFEFVADKAGIFEYYCSVGNHRQMGMKGTLTVQ